MNIVTSFPDFVDVNMTSKGQVLIPKAIRDKSGLRPGHAVAIGLNDRGEVVVTTPEALRRMAENPEQRRARIRNAIAAVAGNYDFGGGTTEEIMRDLRGDRDP